MKSDRNILLIVLIVLLLPGISRSSDKPQDEPVLWNVDANGDTLKYLNIFPTTGKASIETLPSYYQPVQYDSVFRQLSHSTTMRNISSDPLQLLKLSPEYQGQIATVQPERKPLWWPVALIAVSGVTSAYYKLEANHTYDQYLRSIDRNNISHYYNLTKKYDTVSGVSFVFLQVGFGWLTYELMR